MKALSVQHEKLRLKEGKRIAPDWRLKAHVYLSSNCLWALSIPRVGLDSTPHCLSLSREECEQHCQAWLGLTRALGCGRTLHLSEQKFAFCNREAPVPSMSNVIN